jgi:two-component system, cell cycle response regulator
MLTVRSALADRVEGLNIGADDYLAKPFADEELEARIFAALRVKAAHAELRERNQQLESMLHSVEAMASTDALTGLYNRRRFADVLKREFAVTKRYRNTLSCLLLDLDHFKSINDRFGHDAGDQVLKEVARRITGSLREVDLAARYGGEEFVVLLPHTSKTDARIVAERLLKNVHKQEFVFGKEVLNVTTSIGCAGNSDVISENAEDLVKAADIALYEAKNGGRNRVVMYSSGAVSDERVVGSSKSLPAPGLPFPASLPPAGPFQVSMPRGIPIAGAPGAPGVPDVTPPASEPGKSRG